MKTGIFTRGESSHSYKWEDAFANGLAEHGIYAEKYKSGDRPTDITLGVLWGVHNRALTQHFKQNNIDYVVLERGYIGDRTKWTSCGFNGLNGNADFVLQHADNKRLHLVRDYLQPARKKEGDYILIMGQIASDASVKWIGWNDWLQTKCDELKKDSDLPIYYRPHPLDHGPFIPRGLEVKGGELQDAIDGAAGIVTLTSNTGVDAMLAGVPVVCDAPGSMIYGIDITNRGQWLQNMSYCQWSIEEIESGETWSHLKRRYE